MEAGPSLSLLQEPLEGSSILSRASLVAQEGKEFACNWETCVQSLGWEDPGEGNGYPLSILLLENPLTEELHVAAVHGVTKT